MALPSAIKLFINPRSGLAFGNFAGTSQITNPTVTLGDTARFEIYLVEDTSLSNYPRQEVAFPGTPGIKVAVGPIDESPQAGTWKVSFGGDITAALAFNITAAALATALNGLASITAAGGVTVSKIGDNYNIVFNNNGARGDILTDSTALIPLSTATVAKLQIGDSTRPQIALIHLQRTIAGLATSFTATPDCAITVETLAAWDGNRAEYRASISPDPKGGSFSLAFDAATGTDVSSASIAVGASGLDVQNALNLGALVDKVSVSQVGAYAYDITVTAQPGTNGLTANGAGLISFSGYVGELSLNTAEAISLLDGANFVLTNLEVEITSDSKTLTVLQIPCTLKNAVIDAGSVQPLILDVYQTEAAADGRYTRQANNLSDLANAATARTNLGVYSTSSVDTALALKASLAGATFSGEVAAPTLGNLLNADLVIDSYNDTGAGTHYYHKFTPFDGKFVLAPNGGGITFPDGTTQASAVVGSFLPLTGGTLTGNLSLGVNEVRFASGTAGVLQSSVTSTFLAFSSGSSSTTYANGTATFGQVNNGTWTQIDRVQGFFQGVGDNAGSVRARIADGITLTGTASQIKFADLSIQTTAWLPANYLTASAVTSLLNGKADTSALAAKADTSALAAKADLAGATFTGKVNLPARTSGGVAYLNLGTVADNLNNPSTLVEGDLFFTDGDAATGAYNVRLNYVGKTFSGSLAAMQVAVLNGNPNFFTKEQTILTNSSSAAMPSLRINQAGTAPALVVEDSTTPDTSALVVESSGNVGIGVAAGYTATHKLEVVGNIKADAFKNGVGPTYSVVSTDTHSGGSDTHDLFVSVGGSTYRIGMRFVSTP